MKAGITKDIICKNCGKKVGRVTLKSRLKWLTIAIMLIVALILELIANTFVYLLYGF